MNSFKSFSNFLISYIVCVPSSSPVANGNFYTNFNESENAHHNDGDGNDAEVIECSIVKPPQSIQEVLKDVIVYVEYRSDTENRTIGIKDYIASLGAKVNDRLLR